MANVALLACLASLAGGVSAMPLASNDGAVRASIDALCAARDLHTRGTDPVVVARIYGSDETSGTWRVASAALLARVARDPDLYSDVARVYRADGSVAIARIRTRSLDFHEDSESCYRASGTLARERETSSGTVNRDDESRYLDESGRVVARSSRLSPLSPSPGASISPDLKAAMPELYRTVRALPFWSVLTAQKRQSTALRKRRHV